MSNTFVCCSLKTQHLCTLHLVFWQVLRANIALANLRDRHRRTQTDANDTTAAIGKQTQSFQAIEVANPGVTLSIQTRHCFERRSVVCLSKPLGGHPPLTTTLLLLEFCGHIAAAPNLSRRKTINARKRLSALSTTPQMNEWSDWLQTHYTTLGKAVLVARPHLTTTAGRSFVDEGRQTLTAPGDELANAHGFSAHAPQLRMWIRHVSACGCQSVGSVCENKHSQ